MDEVHRLPSNRQIIPLTSGRSGIGPLTSGSITVEVRNCLCYSANCPTCITCSVHFTARK